jgi:tellurite resistance protein
MILIGTLNWSNTRSRGFFHCPTCASREAFRLKATRPFLTLYFIPVLPIGGLEESVQCTRCKNVYDPVILTTRMDTTNTTTSDQSGKAKVAFEQDLLTVIALMMMEDGRVTEQEISVALQVYSSITRLDLSREALAKACAQSRMTRAKTMYFLNECRLRREHEEKLLLVQAMFAVAGAEGEISPGRLQSLAGAQEALELDPSEFQRAVSATQERLSMP